MNKALEFAEKISYRHRHQKRLSIFKENMNKYINMKDDEFLFLYTDVCTKYEKNKVLLSIASISLITSILMNVWNFLYQGIISLLTTNTVNDESRTTVIYISLIVVFMVILLILIILINLIKTQRSTYSEKIFLEDIKKNQEVYRWISYDTFMKGKNKMAYQSKEFTDDLRDDIEVVEAAYQTYQSDPDNKKKYLQLKESIYALSFTIKHAVVNGELPSADAENMKEYFWGLLL